MTTLYRPIYTSNEVLKNFGEAVFAICEIMSAFFDQAMTDREIVIILTQDPYLIPFFPAMQAVMLARRHNILVPLPGTRKLRLGSYIQVRNN